MKDKSSLYKVRIKDECNGVGDVSVYKGKGDRALPDEAFRACFCIFRVTVLFDNEELAVYEEVAPNLVRRNRPLLEAIADENDHASSLVCMITFENDDALKSIVVIPLVCNLFQIS